MMLATGFAAEKRIPVKVVVVTMFERGADTGDEPGEFQYWVEREKLDKVYAFPQGYHDLRMNDKGVLGIVTGVGTAKAAASIMALGLDPRFDLKNAYWLVAGIAGIDPADGSLGESLLYLDAARDPDNGIPPGASAETMAASVATPIERSLSDISGVTSMISSSSPSRMARRRYESKLMRWSVTRLCG